MVHIFRKTSFIQIISILVLRFEFHCSENAPVNIKDICELSEERYPDKDHSVQDILQTYELCLQKLNNYPTTTRETLIKQLIDKLDCFKEDLKHLYYAGNVKYNDVELVESLEESLKSKGFKLGKLLTNHINCNLPRHARSTVKHIIPLVVTGSLSEKQKACEAIFKKDKGFLARNYTDKEVPTPSFDSDKDPTVLTVPLANSSVYKVDSEEAENALTQYYKVVMKCLTLTTEHKIQVFRFNKKFYDWLTQAVLPHLKDDKCYPAFGGVLRIVETMRQNDFVPKNATANFIFYRQKDLGKGEEELRKKEETPERILHFRYFPLMLIPILLFGCCVIFFVCWRAKCLECYGTCCRKDAADGDSTETEIFYYPIEDSCSVSLVLDEVSSNPSTVRSNDSQKVNRQRGGTDSQMYKVYQQEMLMGLPLKRLWSSKNSVNYTELPSPGKRQKKK